MGEWMQANLSLQPWLAILVILVGITASAACFAFAFGKLSVNKIANRDAHNSSEWEGYPHRPLERAVGHTTDDSRDHKPYQDGEVNHAADSTKGTR